MRTARGWRALFGVLACALAAAAVASGFRGEPVQAGYYALVCALMAWLMAIATEPGERRRRW